MRPTTMGDIIGYLAVLTPLILGILGAIKGTKVWRRKKLREAFAEREAELKVKSDELKTKESELDGRDARLMADLGEKVEKLALELDKERRTREQQSAEFFRILQTFRNREWKLMEHINVLETLLRAKGIEFTPLAQELRELPQELHQFFRRSTDPQQPGVTS